MHVYIIKTIIEIIVLITLWVIANNQEARIEILEEKVEGNAPWRGWTKSKNIPADKLMVGMDFGKEPQVEIKAICTKCAMPTQPIMECRCKERQSDGSWKSKIRKESFRLTKSVQKDKGLGGGNYKTDSRAGYGGAGNSKSVKKSK